MSVGLQFSHLSMFPDLNCEFLVNQIPAIRGVLSGNKDWLETAVAAPTDATPR
jgi:hypothetical protein